MHYQAETSVLQWGLFRTGKYGASENLLTNFVDAARLGEPFRVHLVKPTLDARNDFTDEMTGLGDGDAQFLGQLQPFAAKHHGARDERQGQELFLLVLEPGGELLVAPRWKSQFTH